MVSWKELIASFKQQRIVQEASDQQRILLLLFILGQENFNSTYPHETAKSLKKELKHLYAVSYAIKFEALREGQSAQIMHIGPYSEESTAIKMLHDPQRSAQGKAREDEDHHQTAGEEIMSFEHRLSIPDTFALQANWF